MCKRCDAVRYQAFMLLSLTFANQSTMTVMQTIAAIYAALKYEAVSCDKEAEFKSLWNDLAKTEFEHIAELNPMEPAKFDTNYDFRDHIKHG